MTAFAELAPPYGTIVADPPWPTGQAGSGYVSLHDQHLCPECGAWRDRHDVQCANCGSRSAPVPWKGGGD